MGNEVWVNAGQSLRSDRGEMLVECIDLDGDALVTAFGTLQFLAEGDTDIHLVTVQIDDAPARTIHTHCVFQVENLVICVIHPF